MTGLYGVTIQQPYASLIAHGIKTIETRGFQPRVVKPGDDIAIIAGATVPADGSVVGDWACWRWGAGAKMDRRGVHEVTGDEIALPFGAVVAVARFVGALPMEGCPPYSTSFDDRWEPPAGGVIYLGGLDGGPWMFDPEGHGPFPLTDQLPHGVYEPGRFGWLLDNVRRLPEPIPCTGFQGLRALPDDVAAAVHQALVEGDESCLHGLCIGNTCAECGVVVEGGES